MLMIQISKIYARSTIGDKILSTVGVVQSGGGLVTLVDSILGLAVPLGIFCAGILLSFAAFKMISSKGDPEALKDAREQIGNAITGLIFILLSGAILVLISNIILTGTTN